MRPRQSIGVDWSGSADPARSAAAIWAAVVREGRLVALHTGLTREAVVGLLCEEVLLEPETVVGLDFCFSVPAWYARERGWRSVGEVWRWAARWEEAGGDLAALGPPFWGPGVGPSPGLGDAALRETDRAARRPGAVPRSVFAVAGRGSVGAQSLRGMPALLRLADAGVAIWPFDRPRLPMAVEVFPRRTARDLRPDLARLAGDAFRRELVAGLPDAAVGDHRATIAGNQDAFDAVVAAWGLDRDADRLAALGHPDDPVTRIEGRIHTAAP